MLLSPAQARLPGPFSSTARARTTGAQMAIGPGVSDLFGKAGRAWLARVELPFDERVTIEGCLRQIAFLDAEIAIVEQAIAERALASSEIRRLLTVPGVDMITAATFMAFVGDIARFCTPRQLVGYFGLDPKVRQSGSGPARHGRISKEGASEARHVLCEAAKAAARTPGPLRAFAHRVRARRGSNIATVAVARKLCVLFWHLLSTSEDYAYGRPSLTAKKLRRLELLLGAQPRRGRTPGVPADYGRKALRDQERQLTAHAEQAYRRLVADWSASGPKKTAGAGAANGARTSRPSTGQAARQATAPEPALQHGVHPHPTGSVSQPHARVQTRLDFHPPPVTCRHSLCVIGGITQTG